MDLATNRSLLWAYTHLYYYFLNQMWIFQSLQSAVQCNFPLSSSTILWDPLISFGPHWPLPARDCHTASHSCLQGLFHCWVPPLLPCHIGVQESLWYSSHPYLSRYIKWPFHICGLAASLYLCQRSGDPLLSGPTNLSGIWVLPDFFYLGVRVQKLLLQDLLSPLFMWLFLPFSTLLRPGESFLVGRQGVK